MFLLSRFRRLWTSFPAVSCVLSTLLIFFLSLAFYCMQMSETAITREYTINLNRRILHIVHKKRAPRALKEIKKFAMKVMKTKTVKVDVAVNKLVWSRGIRAVPNKIRVRIARKHATDEDSKVRS